VTASPSGALYVATVPVSIINGVYLPCKHCHWFSVCVVPNGRSLSNVNTAYSREIYKCEEYTSRTPQ
jgi:hypothetical protein